MATAASELQPGEEVSWNWGHSTPTGKIVSVDETPKTITTKNNTKVTKKGDAENPAVHIKTPKGVDVLKRASELNEVDLESTSKTVEEKQAKLGRKEEVVRESEGGDEEDVIDGGGHVVDEEEVEETKQKKLMRSEEEEEISSENYKANDEEEVSKKRKRALKANSTGEDDEGASAVDQEADDNPESLVTRKPPNKKARVNTVGRDVPAMNTRSAVSKGTHQGTE